MRSANAPLPMLRIGSNIASKLMPMQKPSSSRPRSRRKSPQRRKQTRDDCARQGAATKLRTDPVLLSVLGADPRDVTALVVGKDTANVIRNMEGHPVFQNRRPQPVCHSAVWLLSPTARNGVFLASVTHTIIEKGGLVANEPSLMATVCVVANEFGRYDLVLFSGAQVANGTLEVLSPLVDTLRQRQSVSSGTFTVRGFLAGEAAKAAAAKAEAAKQAAERDEARAGFQTRDATTISGIHLGSAAAVVCLMASDADGVRYILKTKRLSICQFGDRNKCDFVRPALPMPFSSH